MCYHSYQIGVNYVLDDDLEEFAHFVQGAYALNVGIRRPYYAFNVCSMAPGPRLAVLRRSTLAYRLMTQHFLDAVLPGLLRLRAF